MQEGGNDALRGVHEIETCILSAYPDRTAPIGNYLRDSFVTQGRLTCIDTLSMVKSAAVEFPAIDAPFCADPDATTRVLHERQNGIIDQRHGSVVAMP